MDFTKSDGKRSNRPGWVRFPCASAIFSCKINYLEEKMASKTLPKLYQNPIFALRKSVLLEISARSFQVYFLWWFSRRRNLLLPQKNGDQVNPHFSNFTIPPPIHFFHNLFCDLPLTDQHPFKGMTTRDIVATFKEMYDADVSATLISKVTDSVLEQVHAWQNRPLDDVYPIIYLDCIVVKIRQDNQVINKSVYLALGINSEGHKELMGIWFAETEGAKFWLSVLTELQNRGLKDIFIACVDGLKGFPDAIKTVYPEAKVQLCIVHMVRNSLKYPEFPNHCNESGGVTPNFV